MSISTSLRRLEWDRFFSSGFVTEIEKCSSNNWNSISLETKRCWATKLTIPGKFGACEWRSDRVSNISNSVCTDGVWTIWEGAGADGDTIKVLDAEN